MKAYATQSIRNVGIAGHGDTGKTQLVSSLLFTAGMTTRLGKVAEGNTVTDWDEEEIARKITIHSSLAYAEWAPSGKRQHGPGGKNKNQFSGHAGLQHVSERHARVAGGGRRRADRGGRRGGRAGGHGKSVGLRDRVRRAARVRHQLDGPRAGQLRPRDGIDHARVRPQRRAAAVADRRGENVSRRGRPDHHEGARLHAGRRRQAEGRGDSRRIWPRRPRSRTKRWWKWWPRATTR